MAPRSAARRRRSTPQCRPARPGGSGSATAAVRWWRARKLWFRRARRESGQPRSRLSLNIATGHRASDGSPYMTVWCYDGPGWRLSIQWCMVDCRRKNMTDQLSAKDWLDQGLRALAKSGFTALKAEPLAKAMGVSRGSFYWHFADIGAFHSAILRHWREVAAEQIIANLEAAADRENPILLLLRQAFGGGLALEKAVRTWGTLDPAARSAVQAIDRRRLGYIESLLRASGLSPDVAGAC